MTEVSAKCKAMRAQKTTQEQILMSLDLVMTSLITESKRETGHPVDSVKIKSYCLSPGKTNDPEKNQVRGGWGGRILS